jgi:hypothetical protein
VTGLEPRSAMDETVNGDWVVAKVGDWDEAVHGDGWSRGRRLGRGSARRRGWSRGRRLGRGSAGDGVGAEVGDCNETVHGDWVVAKSATGTGQCSVTGLEPRSAATWDGAVLGDWAGAEVGDGRGHAR